MGTERATKMLILGAARTLFSEKGYEQTTVEEICMLAGVAKGTFFYHFESKQYIVRFIMAQQRGEYAKKLRTQTALLGDAVAQMAFFIAALIDQSEACSETEGYFKDGLPAWFKTVEGEERMRALYPLLEEITRAGISEGSFRVKHPDICASITLLGIGQYLDGDADGDSARGGIREFAAKTLGLRETALAI